MCLMVILLWRCDSYLSLFIIDLYLFFGKVWIAQTPEKSSNEEEGMEEAEEESDGAFLVRKQMHFFKNKSSFEFQFKLLCVSASGFISM